MIATILPLPDFLAGWAGVAAGWPSVAGAAADMGLVALPPAGETSGALGGSTGLTSGCLISVTGLVTSLLVDVVGLSSMANYSHYLYY